jgi:dynein heavy chain
MLDESFQLWQDMLKVAESKLDKSSREFKREVEISLDDFTKSVSENRQKFLQNAPFGVENMDNRKAMKQIAETREEVRMLREKEEGLKFGLKHFEITLVSLKDLTDVEKDLNLLEEIWNIKQKWDRQWEMWKNMKFLELDIEVMSDLANEYNK